MASRFWKLADIEYAGSRLTLSQLWLGLSGSRADTLALVTSSAPPISGSLSALQDDTASACTFGPTANGSLSITWDMGSSVDIDSVNVASPHQGEHLFRAVFYTSDDGVYWVRHTPTPIFPWAGVNTASGYLPIFEWEVLWEEDFAGGIPGGFATTSTEGGTLTVTHDAANEAVILDATGTNSAWMFSYGVSQETCRVDLDYDMLTETYGNQARQGVVFYNGNRSDVIFFGQPPEYDVYSGYTSTSTVISFAEYTDYKNTPYSPNEPGVRTAISVPHPVGGKRIYKLGRGEQLTTLRFGAVASGDTVKPGIYLRSCKILLRGVKVWVLAPGPRWAQFPVLGSSPRRLSPLQGALPALPSGVSMTPFWKTYDTLITGGGAGRIKGTVVEDANPDLPRWRLVRLYREQDGMLVDAVWSDEVTGKFEFTRVNIDYTYTTLSYDHTGVFQAVLKSGIRMRLNT